MNGEQPPGERKADLARAAVSTYAQSSLAPGEPFSPAELEPEPGTDRDRLASLLCGLMHHADYSRVSFDDALRAARDEYRRERRERPAYLPGDPVRLRDNGVFPAVFPDVHFAGTGEVLRSRLGKPAQYEADFITYREWIPEPGLTSGPPFPAVVTSTGTITSAHQARQALIVTAAAIEVSFRRRWEQHPETLGDLRALLSALSGWTGISGDDLLARLDSEIQQIIRPPGKPGPAARRASPAAGGGQAAALSGTCFPHSVTRAAVPPAPRDDTPGHAARSPREEQPRRRAGGAS
jgi:hypothetical protein